MEDIDTKEYENAYNDILPGLQMFVRDTFLEDQTEKKYEIGKILREPTFCDVSHRVGGLITTHRYAILSNHFINFSDFEHGTNWGLFVCKRDSYFKVLDVFKLNGKTQISLLHLNDNWKLFENITSNVENDIVKMCRERFEKKYNIIPIPALATKLWLERLLYPIGIDEKNNYFSLNEKNTNTNDSIKTMDSILEKAYKEIDKNK
jgi:hypothetical protein